MQHVTTVLIQSCHCQTAQQSVLIWGWSWKWRSYTSRCSGLAGCQTVVTYKTRTTSTPTYLSHLIHDYNPGRCLRYADKLFLTVLRTSLALSAKTFSVSTPAVWNSLSFECRSCKLFSTFARMLKMELFDTAYFTLSHSLPSCISDSLATHGAA